MMTLLTSGIVMSVVFLALFIIKRPKEVHDQILMIWFSLFIIHMGLLIARIYIRDNQAILVMVNTISMFYGPLLYVYTLTIFKGQLPNRAWVHFVPILIITIAGFFPEFHPYSFSYMVVPIKVLYYSVYPILVIVIVRKGIMSLKMNRSDQFVPNIIWIQGVAIILLVSLGVAIFILLITTSFSLENYQFYDRLRFVITIFILGIYGLKLGVIFKPDDYQRESENQDDRAYKNSPLESNDRKQIVDRLTHFFKEDQSFLNSDFSLSSLSKRLEIPKHHLSEIINSDLDTSFYELVNHHRIQFAAKRIADNTKRHFTLEAIGYECGYNSKSAFFGHFKRNLGKTPRQYLLEISTS